MTGRIKVTARGRNQVTADTQIKKIKDLEDQNRRLKQLAGEQALVIDAMKEYQKKRGWL